LTGLARLWDEPGGQVSKRAKNRRAKAKKQLGFVPAFIEQSSGRERGIAGNGGGAHQDTSPMARATVTPNKKEKQRRKDRRSKQNGW